MNEIFAREARLIGEDGVEWLSQKSAAVFGIGGVGSYAAEALVRAGLGRLVFIDKDTVDPTNLNRQLVAEQQTIAQAKAEIMAGRAHHVNPFCEAIPLTEYFKPGDHELLESLHVDFVIDAIDDIPAKVAIASECFRLGIPEASAMGAGNRLHPEMLQIADITETSVCPMAKKMRKELKKAGVPHLTVVYSEEPPIRPRGEGHAPGSISFVPPAAGMILAGIAVRHLLSQKEGAHGIPDQESAVDHS